MAGSGTSPIDSGLAAGASRRAAERRVLRDGPGAGGAAADRCRRGVIRFGMGARDRSRRGDVAGSPLRGGGRRPPPPWVRARPDRGQPSHAGRPADPAGRRAAQRSCSCSGESTFSSLVSRCGFPSPSPSGNWSPSVRSSEVPSSTRRRDALVVRGCDGGHRHRRRDPQAGSRSLTPHGGRRRPGW